VAGGMVKGRDIGGRTLKPFGGRPGANLTLDDFWFI